MGVRLCLISQLACYAPIAPRSTCSFTMCYYFESIHLKREREREKERERDHTFERGHPELEIY